MTIDDMIKKTLWRYNKSIINYYQMKREMKRLLNKREE